MSALVGQVVLKKGFQVGKDNVHVSFLQCADDILVFCKNQNGTLINLIQKVGFFGWSSGLKVHWEKLALCGIKMAHVEN